MLQHRKNDRFNSLEKTRQNNYLNAVIEAKLEEVESRFKDGSEENMSRMIEYYIKNELGNQNAEYEEIE